MTRQSHWGALEYKTLQHKGEWLNSRDIVVTPRAGSLAVLLTYNATHFELPTLADTDTCVCVYVCVTLTGTTFFAPLSKRSALRPLTLDRWIPPSSALLPSQVSSLMSQHVLGVNKRPLLQRWNKTGRDHVASLCMVVFQYTRLIHKRQSWDTVWIHFCVRMWPRALSDLAWPVSDSTSVLLGTLPLLFPGSLWIMTFLRCDDAKHGRWSPVLEGQHLLV